MSTEEKKDVIRGQDQPTAARVEVIPVGGAQTNLQRNCLVENVVERSQTRSVQNYLTAIILVENELGNYSTPRPSALSFSNPAKRMGGYTHPLPLLERCGNKGGLMLSL